MCVTCDPKQYTDTASFDSKQVFLRKRLSDKLSLICTQEERDREYFFCAEDDRRFKFRIYHCPTCGKDLY